MGPTHRLLATAINPEVQHCVDQTMKKLKSAYPKVPKKLKVVFEKRLGATFDPWDWEIKIDNYGKDQPLAVVDKQEDSDQGSGVLQYGFEGTLIHEFGHAINATIIKLFKKDDELLGEWQQTKKDLEHQLGHPSAYSKKNNSEWFAEQFLYERMGHGHTLLKTIDEWMHRS